MAKWRFAINKGWYILVAETTLAKLLAKIHAFCNDVTVASMVYCVFYEENKSLSFSDKNACIQLSPRSRVRFSGAAVFFFFSFFGLYSLKILRQVVLVKLISCPIDTLKVGLDYSLHSNFQSLHGITIKLSTPRRFLCSLSLIHF